MPNRIAKYFLTTAVLAVLSPMGAANADTIGTGVATTCRSTYLTNSLRNVGHKINPGDPYCDTAYFLPLMGNVGPVASQQQVDQAVLKYMSLHPGAISVTPTVNDLGPLPITRPGGPYPVAPVTQMYSVNGKFYTRAQLDNFAGRYSGGTVYIIDNKTYVIAAGGGNVIAAGGGNLTIAMLPYGTIITTNWGRVIAAGGGNVMAAGGGGVISLPNQGNIANTVNRGSVQTGLPPMQVQTGNPPHQ